MSRSNDIDEPFLSRWSRRKREAVVTPQEPAAKDSSPDAAVTRATDAAPGEPSIEAEPELDLSKLPRVEDLTESSDISAFLDRRVPALLRNAALGRMWTLDPTIRDFIEVAENQWDWNVPGGTPFYCAMEPGTGAAQLAADAANTAARGAADTASRATGLREGELPSATSNENSHKIDEAAAQPVPTTHRQPQQLASASDASPSDDGGKTMQTLGKVEDVALQDVLTDESAKGLPLRRRHGGALPV